MEPIKVPVRSGNSLEEIKTIFKTAAFFISGERIVEDKGLKFVEGRYVTLDSFNIYNKLLIEKGIISEKEAEFSLINEFPHYSNFTGDHPGFVIRNHFRAKSTIHPLEYEAFDKSSIPEQTIKLLKERYAYMAESKQTDGLSEDDFIKTAYISCTDQLATALKTLTSSDDSYYEFYLDKGSCGPIEGFSENVLPLIGDRSAAFKELLHFSIRRSKNSLRTKIFLDPHITAYDYYVYRAMFMWITGVIATPLNLYWSVVVLNEVPLFKFQYEDDDAAEDYKLETVDVNFNFSIFDRPPENFGISEPYLESKGK